MPPARLVCPNCQRRLKADDTRPDQPITCPACKTGFRPTPPVTSTPPRRSSGRRLEPDVPPESDVRRWAMPLLVVAGVAGVLVVVLVPLIVGVAYFSRPREQPVAQTGRSAPAVRGDAEGPKQQLARHDDKAAMPPEDRDLAPRPDDPPPIDRDREKDRPPP